MIETELKAMLTPEQYDELHNHFSWETKKAQTNHYYTDSTGELKKHGITFRIRTIDNKNVIQVKKHTNANSPLQICEESEFPINNIPKSFTKDEIEKMTGIAVAASYIGELTTLRSSLFYCDGVEICLDRNNYLDVTDYEIEIEYTKSVPDELFSVLKTYGVMFSRPSKGKFSRFMTRLISIIKNDRS